MTRVDTLLVHPPVLEGEATGATSTPLYQTATFDVRIGRFDYSRSGNPTREVLERQLARLDRARHAWAYTSGIAAVASVLRLVPPGAEIVVGADLYGGTLRLLGVLEEEMGLSVRVVDTSSLEAVARALTPDTAMVWLESPTNPMLRVADIRAIADLAHACGSLLAVDNSVMTPLGQRPLDLGADLAVQSATKFLGGHGDLTAGVVATNDEGLAERLALRHNAEGVALAPMESWLLLRGLETLGVRLRRQLENTELLGRWLLARPEVRRVHSATGAALLSIETAGVRYSRRLVARTRLFRAAVSFGAVGSSISLPDTMSHAAVPDRWRATQALPSGLVRLAVGIENPADLCDDLERALVAAGTRERSA